MTAAPAAQRTVAGGPGCLIIGDRIEARSSIPLLSTVIAAALLWCKFCIHQQSAAAAVV